MTTKIYEASSWNNNNKVAEHHWFSNCCGAKYYKRFGKVALEKAKNYRGITVAVGKVGDEETTDKIELKHVETKNGTITVVARHGW